MIIPEIKQTCDRCHKDEVARYEIADTEFFLCSDCAVNEGFCLNCGGFFDGTEEFMLTGIRGLCVDCETELHESASEYYDIESEDDDGDYADIPY